MFSSALRSARSASVTIGGDLEASVRSMEQHMGRLGRSVERHQRNLPATERPTRLGDSGPQMRLTGDATGRLTAKHDKLWRLIDRTRKRGRGGGAGAGGAQNSRSSARKIRTRGVKNRIQGAKGKMTIASARTGTLPSVGASHAQTNAAAQYTHTNTMRPSISDPMLRSRRPMSRRRLRTPSRPFLCRRRYADMYADVKGSGVFGTKAA